MIFIRIGLTSIIPMMMLLIGIVGNVFIVVVFRRKCFNKTLSRNYFCVMAMCELVALCTVVPYNLPFYGIDTFTVSQYSCKLLTFIAYYSCAVSSWMLALINIERLVSVQLQKTKIFGQVWFQYLVIGALFAYNFGIYFGLVYFTDLVVVNEEILNETLANFTQVYCSQYNDAVGLLFPWVDLLNSLILPFCVILLCSIGIIRSIYLLRKKLVKNNLISEGQNLRKDMIYSCVIIAMSFIFFLFNSPLCLYDLVYGLWSDAVGFPLEYLIIENLFYFQYIFNIFVYFALNAKFRNELFVILKIKVKRKLKISQ